MDKDIGYAFAETFYNEDNDDVQRLIISWKTSILQNKNLIQSKK